MPIQIKDQDFVVDGTSSSFVAQTLQSAGLSDSKVAQIIGAWFVGITGEAQPAPFDFTTVVQATDPSCAITYSRDFAHVDWIDGESRVQAGLTPEELGFNARFHALENEFDAVEAQFVSLGNCVAEIRGDLVGIVAELEAKITTMQNQIHALEQAQPEEAPSILGTATIGDKDVFVTQFDDKFQFVNFEAQAIGGVVGPRPLPEVFDPQGFESDDFVAFAGGLRTTFTNPEVEELFAAGPVTVGDLRVSPKTSTLTLPTGEALGSVLATLPADMTFESPAEAVSLVLEHTMSGLPADAATTVRSGVVGGEAADRTGAALLNSSVSGLGLDEETTAALRVAGFGTVGQLAGADPKLVANALSDAGIDAGRAGSFVDTADVARAVRNFGVG